MCWQTHIRTYVHLCKHTCIHTPTFFTCTTARTCCITSIKAQQTQQSTWHHSKHTRTPCLGVQPQVPPSLLPSFLTSFLPYFLPSFLPSFLASFLPFFLPSSCRFALSHTCVLWCTDSGVWRGIYWQQWRLWHSRACWHIPPQTNTVRTCVPL
jgi:hypothetical protein